MNPPVTGPQLWTRRRLWTTATVLTLVQIGLIYWTSDWTPVHPRTSNAQPTVQFAALARSELLALTDPTIFSRAHSEGFSGAAWMTIPVLEFQGSEPSDTPRWLTLSPAQLGETFREYVRTNQQMFFDAAIRSQPDLTKVGVSGRLPIALSSTVQVEGALAARGLLHIASPPSQTNIDVLPASEVQLLVDAGGDPISAVLTRSSGLKSADQLAVRLAREARFKADRAALQRQSQAPDTGLISGNLIFRWHTVPAPTATNSGPNPR